MFVLNSVDSLLILQTLEHPSVSILLRSSHSSIPAINPSPQIVLQVFDEQSHPSSTLHLSEHPSPFFLLESSHS